MDEKFGVLETFHRRVKEVECMLDHNRLLISEINHNHETRTPEQLTRNVTLIRELNHNILKVVGMYSDMSAVFQKSFENVEDGGAEEDWMSGDKGCVPQSDSRDSSGSDSSKRMRVN